MHGPPRPAPAPPGAEQAVSAPRPPARGARRPAPGRARPRPPTSPGLARAGPCALGPAPHGGPRGRDIVVRESVRLECVEMQMDKGEEKTT